MDWVKQVGTGAYAALDDMFFGLPDFMVDKITKGLGNNRAFKRWKEERQSGKYKTAERIGDIGGMIASIAVPGPAVGGIAKLGKFAPKALKGAKTLQAIAKPTNAFTSVIKAGAIGGANSLADTVGRGLLATTDEEKDAYRQGVGKSLMLGALTGGAVGGLAHGLKGIKNLKTKADRMAKLDDLEIKNIDLDLNGTELNKAYKKNYNQWHKKQSPQTRLEDRKGFAKFLSDEYKLHPTEISTKDIDRYQAVKSRLSNEFGDIYKGIDLNPQTQEGLKNFISDNLKVFGKTNMPKHRKIATILGDAELEDMIYKLDDETQDKLLLGLHKSIKSIKPDASVTVFNAKDAIYNALKADPKLANKMAAKLDDRLDDVLVKAGNDSKMADIRAKRKNWRWNETVNDALQEQMQNPSGKTIMGELAKEKNLEKIVETAAPAVAGALGGAGMSINDIKEGKWGSALGKMASGAAAVYLMPKAYKGLKDVQRISNSAQAKLIGNDKVMDKIVNLAIPKALRADKVPMAINHAIDKKVERGIVADQSEENAKEKARRQQTLDNYNRDIAELDKLYETMIHDYKLDEDLAKKIYNEKSMQIQAQYTMRPEEVLAGKKELAPFVQAKNVLANWDGYSEQERNYWLKQAGLSDNEAKNLTKKLAKYSPGFRAKMINQEIAKKAFGKLSPEDYALWQAWIG